MESVEGDLAEVALDHAQFVRMLSSRRALLKREYYIIVPAEYEKASDPTEALITAQLKLELRMEDLLQQLERMGLTGRRLTRAEIVCHTLPELLHPTEGPAHTHHQPDARRH